MAILHFSTTTTEDLDLVLSIENDKENSKFIIPNSMEEHGALLNNPDVQHSLVKTNEGKVIGLVILAGLLSKPKNIEFRRIAIIKKGKGYGRRTVQLIKNHCFEILKAERIWLDVLEVNSRASQLYLSEGFNVEDILENEIRKDEILYNLVIMSLLKKRTSIYDKTKIVYNPSQF